MARSTSSTDAELDVAITTLAMHVMPLTQTTRSQDIQGDHEGRTTPKITLDLTIPANLLVK